MVHGPILAIRNIMDQWSGMVDARQDGDVQEKWWPYRRLRAIHLLKEEISVFNHPNHNMIFIKRIVALPAIHFRLLTGRCLSMEGADTSGQVSLFFKG